MLARLEAARLKRAQRRNLRARIESEASSLVELVATFKCVSACRPNSHETKHQAMACPCYHGNRDRRFHIWADARTANHPSEWSRISCAQKFRTRMCGGSCFGRGGAVCPFAHNQHELLPELSIGRAHGTRDNYHLWVLQSMLTKAGLPELPDELEIDPPKRPLPNLARFDPGAEAAAWNKMAATVVGMASDQTRAPLKSAWATTTPPPGLGYAGAATTQTSTKPAAQVAAERRQHDAVVQREVEGLATRLNLAPKPTVASPKAMGKLPSDACANETPKECVVCLDPDPCMAWIPCGHVALCPTCAPEVQLCPLCRTERTMAPLRVFI